MATQFDPIAKDQSINTTESPSRNIADVLAQELANLSTAVKPNASNILMSDNVTTVEQAITALETDVTTLKKSNLATRIAIDSYNSSSNLYTFPYDGYVELLPSDNTKTGTIFVFGSQNASSTRCTHIESQNGLYVSLYVRKNMRCYCTGTSNHFFIPIQ